MACTVVFFLCLFWPASLRSEVRVEGDEVVFLLHAPGARRVFLVGDFNNWNPTVEMMAKVGETFRVGLFLVEGEYKYKFVVDGKWISDPDNPPRRPSAPSVVKLEEVRGGLAIMTPSEGEGEREETIAVRARYRGSFRPSEHTSDQEGELLVAGWGRRFRARAIVETRNASWSLSPLQVEVDLDRAWMKVEVAHGWIWAFSADSAWASSDPLPLTGGVGVYHYDVGLLGKGAALHQEVGPFRVRALYADLLGSSPRPLRLSEADVAGLISDPGTILYLPGSSAAGADVRAVEVLFSTPTLALGYGTRSDRGLNPGLLARWSPADSGGGIELKGTDEAWGSSVLWIALPLPGSIHLGACFAWGKARVRNRLGACFQVSSPRALDLSEGAEEEGGSSPLLDSSRLSIALKKTWGRFEVVVASVHDRFRFLPPLVTASRAKFTEASASVNWRQEGLAIAGNVRYLDLDYGRTPLRFSYFSSANYWLQGRDVFTPAEMAAFNLGGFLSWSISVAHGDTLSISREPSSLALMSGVAGGEERRIKFVSLTLFHEEPITSEFYLQGDGRICYYSRSKRAYFDPYLEVGYRSKGIEASLGYGLDPVSFDPVRNDYYRWSRLDYLRRALKGVDGQGPLRGTDLEGESIAREEKLAREGKVKVEIVVRF